MENSIHSRTAYVYLIVFNPDPLKVYVGKTLMSPKRRWYAHCGEARRRGGTSSMLIARAIAKHGEDKFRHHVLEVCTASTAGDLERKWIKKYRDDGYVLYNRTDGGDGPYGWNHSMETKLKISEANKGKVISPEQNRKISIRA
jgi:group I intron endonuclease